VSTKESEALFARAVERIPGGVNSPVRAFKAVGGTPRFIARAEGARLWDEDGNEYIDLIGAWGPVILGHAHPVIVEAVRRQAALGVSVGTPTRLEVEMAEAISALVPSMERVRMVNSGTEATMSAIRVARAATGRDLVIKFEGCYHGHGDAFLAKAGSGAATLGIPSSPGVPAATAGATLNARYNDLDSVAAHFDAHAGRVAAVIVEPIAGNMGVVLPVPGFLQGLRDLCTRHGAVLIFDEVMTGFRVASGGAQELYGIRPDLTCLGKIVGGGLPVAAYGGRADIMRRIAPEGPVYQAGTLSGNPLGMAAGLAVLNWLTQSTTVHGDLERAGAALEAAILAAIAETGAPCSVARAGSMLTLFFRPQVPRNWDEAATCDTAAFARWFHGMLSRGVHPPPAQYEAWFLSLAHGEAEIALIAGAVRGALAER